jgi:hypothetical protein
VRYDTATPYYLIAMAYLYSDVFLSMQRGARHPVDRACNLLREVATLPCDRPRSDDYDLNPNHRVAWPARP